MSVRLVLRLVMYGASAPLLVCLHDMLLNKAQGHFVLLSAVYTCM